ncbi:MAG: hypothetical protein AB1757_28915 [Acidobacteriota bacterium]
MKQLFWLITGVVLISFLSACKENPPPTGNPTASQPPVTTPTPTPPAPQPNSQPTQPSPVGAPITMEVAKAVMVTVELDFGKSKLPTIAEALKQIERQYKPDDGAGRTFAILDAYGEPTPDGKLLHMQMHVSSEKPGKGKLIFKRTGEVLWDATITPMSTPMPQKTLRVLMSPSYTIDVSKADKVPILESPVFGQNKLVKDMWEDGGEREITFIFSACGCPVKSMVKRVGNKTQRSTDMPVMFPDDPEAYQVIAKLMGWS